MSISLSRKSLTEATLRRMMGWRGAIHCSFPWPSWRPRFPTLCSACQPQKDTKSAQRSHRQRINSLATDTTQCEWLHISKSEIKGVPEAKRAVRPFVRPTPGLGRGGSPSQHPSLMLGFEPQAGRSTHKGKNSLFPLSVEDPWQQHFSTTDSNTWERNKVSLYFSSNMWHQGYFLQFGGHLCALSRYLLEAFHVRNKEVFFFLASFLCNLIYLQL